MKNGRVRIASLVCALVVLGLVVCVQRDTLAVAQNSGSVTLSAPYQVPESGTFTARVNISSAIGFSAYQVQLDYDPTVIQVIGVEGGVTGVTPGIVNFAQIPVTMWAFNPPGKPTGSVRILGMVPAGQEAQGAGYLLELHFQVLGDPGSSTGITPSESGRFVNSLFNKSGDKVSTVDPWGGASCQVVQPLTTSISSLQPASLENIYIFNLVGSGGTPPYFWSASGLPQGLTISSSGNISGTAIFSGEYNVNINLTDSAYPPASLNLVLPIRVYPVLQIKSNVLPESNRNQNYSYALDLSEALGPLIFGTSGLPAGLQLSGSGIVSGSPTVSGDFNVAITISDSFIPPHIIEAVLPFKIYDVLSVVTSQLPSGLELNAYSANVNAGGGKSGYLWSAVGLPPGLSLSPSGVINGVLVMPGIFNVTFSVSDGFVPPNVTSRTLILSIYNALKINTTSLPDGIAGKAYSATLNASGSNQSYHWNVGGLPEGLVCSTGGIIGGVPKVAGNSTLQIRVEDSLSPANVRDAVLNLHVNENLQMNFSQLPEALIGKAYNVTLAASGSQGPYTWQINGLPAGLTASNTGIISGTANVTGDFLVNLNVADSVVPPNHASEIMNLKIYQVGDANGDGVINIGDITYIERAILNLSRETPGCDANMNGNISISDVTRLERMILRLN